MTEGEMFQHYQVLRRPDGSAWELGRGAMGITFKALDTSLHCPVALKVIRSDSLDSEGARRRFVREARAAAGLNHPNVARVFHLGEAEQSYFYAMEFLDGETLEACVRRRGPLPPRLALQITLQTANALRAAAREGLVHRDIKPSNLMLLREEEDPEDEVHVKVIDFGLAKRTRGEAAGKSVPQSVAGITRAGFVGTPNYASPEQLDEKEFDARSDIYSLGVTLWFMLAGRPPFTGSVVQVMSQHLHRQPPFRELGEQPEPVVFLLRRMLAKEPANRPQSAGILRREIEEALERVEIRRLVEKSGHGETGESVRLVTPLVTHTPRPERARAEDQPGEIALPASVWQGLGTLFLLFVGFVIIASLVALAAWYLLGPGTVPPPQKPVQKGMPVKSLNSLQVTLKPRQG